MVRKTSIKTYADLKITGAISKMQEQVMQAYRKDPDATDKEISEYHDIEINVVTARRNELVEQGIIIDAGKRNCDITGRLAHIWRVRNIKDINAGKPKGFEFLKHFEMEGIKKKIPRANKYQKKKIKEWCDSN